MAGYVGVVHPGEMGAAVAVAAATNREVCWASQGRSQATLRRAGQARLVDLGTIDALVTQTEIILSVCPPYAAIAVAREVSGLGFQGVFADLNAVAPQTAREIGELVARGGGAFVDGGIIGPPGSARLYLCGDHAERVASLFGGSPFEAKVTDGDPGAASALKACYAAWTKGSDALLLAIRALACAEGVEAPLLAEWSRSQPALAPASERAVGANARKAWRFVGEMEQIAETFAAAGLPDGFHHAAAVVFARLDDFKDAPQPPTLEEALQALSAGPGRPPPLADGGRDSQA